MAESTASSVPDVLAPGLTCVFCGINPGRVSAAAAAHFANPRNDFWRLLHDAGFTPRLYEPQEQFSLLELGIGVTNAAYRTTPGSGDLRRGDFDAPSFEARIRAVAPLAVAFVGPNTQEIMQRANPVLEPVESKKAPVWLLAPRWAYAMGFLLAAVLCSLGNVSEFLYFQF